MKRPQKLAVMLVPTPPYEICGLSVYLLSDDSGLVTGSLIDYSQRVVGTLSMPAFNQN